MFYKKGPLTPSIATVKLIVDQHKPNASLASEVSSLEVYSLGASSVLGWGLQVAGFDQVKQTGHLFPGNLSQGICFQGICLSAWLVPAGESLVTYFGFTWKWGYVCSAGNSRLHLPHVPAPAHPDCKGVITNPQITTFVTEIILQPRICYLMGCHFAGLWISHVIITFRASIAALIKRFPSAAASPGLNTKCSLTPLGIHMKSVWSYWLPQDLLKEEFAHSVNRKGLLM